MMMANSEATATARWKGPGDPPMADSDQRARRREPNVFQQPIRGESAEGARTVDRYLLGDSVLAEFASAVEAVACATEVQKDLARRNAQYAEHRRMRFRIGINLGDVIDEEGSIYGNGVNVAARLQALADPGGICVSGTVFDQVEGKLPATFKFLGEQQVKNIPQAGPDLSAAIRGHWRPWGCAPHPRVGDCRCGGAGRWTRWSRLVVHDATGSPARSAGRRRGSRRRRPLRGQASACGSSAGTTSAPMPTTNTSPMV